MHGPSVSIGHWGLAIHAEMILIKGDGHANYKKAPDSKETRPGSRNIRPLLTHFCVGVRRLSAVPTDTTLTDAFALTLPPIREGATPAGKQGTGGTPAFRAYVSNVPPAEPPRNVRAMKSVTLAVGSLRLD